MCHIVKWKNAHKAQTPIRCHKVVIKAYDETGGHSYHPVFINSLRMTYEIGRTEKSSRPKTYNMNSEIVTEGLHSFRSDVPGWIGTARWLDINLPNIGLFPVWNGVKTEAAVLECVIPAGAWYFKGEANCIFGGPDEAGFVSDTLTPVREVPREEWPDMSFDEYSKRNGCR